MQPISSTPLPAFPQGINLAAQVPGLGDGVFECFSLRRSNHGGTLLVEAAHGCGNLNCGGLLHRDAALNIPCMKLNLQCCAADNTVREKVFLQIMATIATIHDVSNGVEAFALTFEDGRSIQRALIPFKIGHKVQVLDFLKDGHKVDPIGQTVWAGEMRGSGGEHKLTTRNLPTLAVPVEMKSFATSTNHYLIPTLRCITDGLYLRSHSLVGSIVQWDVNRREATTSLKLLPGVFALKLFLPCLRIHISYSEEFISSNP
jgi:hypothetical protein